MAGKESEVAVFRERLKDHDPHAIKCEKKKRLEKGTADEN